MIIGSINNKKINSSDLRIEGLENFRLDEIVNSALLLTLAGYLEEDDITVNGNQYFSKKDLKSFFNYILNNQRSAPRTYNPRINFSNSDLVKDKITENDYECIVSFSGGIDSTAGILYALDKGYSMQPVWIGFGQKNEENELRVVRKICKKLQINPILIKIDLKKYVDQGWNRWKMGIIPARNYLFASIAASMASLSTSNKNTIFICAHKEEINPENTDKSERFYKTCTKIFTESYKKKIELTTPFSEATKPEMIYYWIKNWAKKYGIAPQDTVSCYHGNKCGSCKACINRVVAFSCCGLSTEKFVNNPFNDSERIIKKSYIDRFESLKLERKLDFLFAMKSNIRDLPANLKKFLEEEYGRYEKKIVRRQLQIRKGSNIK